MGKISRFEFVKFSRMRVRSFFYALRSVQTFSRRKYRIDRDENGDFAL